MSEERLTYLERWALAVGAPVIAAGIIALCGFLWSINNSQIEIQKTLGVVTTQLYTKREAKLEFRRIDNRMDGQSKRIDALERRVMPERNNGVGQ